MMGYYKSIIPHDRLRGFLNRVVVLEYPMPARATHVETSCLNWKINKLHDNV
jgi:hypothetical protein